MGKGPEVKRATLTREPFSDAGTFGLLAFGTNNLRSVELPWRDNQPRKSSIPIGVYRCELVNSPKFGRVYCVLDVPGRSHILIHAANFGGDVELGFPSDLLGCIAPVMSIGMLQTKAGAMQKGGLKSRNALELFMSWAAGEPIELEIR